MKIFKSKTKLPLVEGKVKKRIKSSSPLKFVKGTKFVSLLFIGFSVLIAAGVLWAANMYYNIDTGEVVTEEIKRITGVLRATGGAIVAGTATQNPSAGYGFESATTSLFSAGDVVLSAANQVLRFTGGTSFYTGFQATTSLSTTTIYSWPGAFPAGSQYFLTANPTTGQMSWDVPSGAGDVSDVGDCTNGACFTANGTGNTLYFEGASADDSEIILTAVDPGTDYTITLPAATGYIALGTSTANYVTYWTSTSTLAGEQYLATTRGGTGQNTSNWSGMLKVVGGAWATTTGTSSYVAYWSDANTVTAEQYLALSRGGTNAGLTAAAGGIVYSGASALAISATGTANQILTSGGTGAPTWQDIADLITVQNGLTESGTTQLTIQLGGTLATTTTITQATYDMIFALTDTGDFRITDGASNIFQVTNDGKVIFGANGYVMAESGKQVLIEMIPIFGFDLPAQTATTSYVKISRTIESYPFTSPATGTTRVHRFVIRYTDDIVLASSTNWRVATTTGSAYSTFTLPGSNNAALDSGQATTTPNVAIPTDSTDWWLEVQSLAPYASNTIRVFQIFLAAYDQIQ